MKTRPATPGKAERNAGHSISRNDATRAHAELARQPPLVGRHAVQRFQQEARRQRQVEEDMRDQDAGQAVDARPIPARQRRKQAGKISGTAVEREQPERGHDRRQRQRQREQPQDQPAAREIRGCRDRARATRIAGPTESTVDSAPATA